MYHSLVRKILTSYLGSTQIPSLEELGVLDHPDIHTKSVSFITLYRQGAVIASSGRISPKRENTILECIDNTLETLKDPRVMSSLSDVSSLDQIQIRVDIIRNEDRRIVSSFSEINPKEEGLLLLSQTLGKLAIVLPMIAPVAVSGSDIFQIVCAKAGLSTTVAPSDIVLYGIRSTRYSDF